MAKRKKKAVIVNDTDQSEMFPELDMSDPVHKKIIAAAKDFSKANAERSNLLKTSKEKVDGKMDRLIGLMHEAKIEKFKFDGYVAEIIHPKEKAEVTVAPEEDDDTDVEDADQ